ncbi:MAG: hypothetical protein ACFFCM_14430, partial [Promethearchaeota archaeon]
MLSEGTEDSIIQLISYFDSFDYPIKLNEITSLLNIEEEEIRESLLNLLNKKKILKSNNYYFVSDKKGVISKRINAERFFQKNLRKIYWAGWLLSHIPFVRGLILTGSASKGVLDKFDDFDFLVITEPNRIWLCRSLIALFQKIVSFNYRRTNHRFFDCNYFITENNLTITDQNEFTGIEIFFARPVYNNKLYQRFIKKNKWITKYFKLPNQNSAIPIVKRKIPFIKSFLEKIINGFLKIFYRNNSIEKRQFLSYYNLLLQNKIVSSLDEYRSKASSTQIKFISNTQQFMLKKLREFNNKEYRSKLRTKILRRKLIFSRKKQNQSLDMIITHASYLPKRNKKEKKENEYINYEMLKMIDFLRLHDIKVGYYDPGLKKGTKNFLKDFSNTFNDGSVGIIAIYVTE